MTQLGKVFLVGAGPGAVDLITVRGSNLLAKANIVFYDALVDPAMLDLCPQAELISVGKRCGKLSTAQKFIIKRLIDASKKHQMIVRLKGGDPMLFGRADEEISALKKEGIEVEVVPGVTAALAAAARIEKSLTLRGVSRSVAFVTLAREQVQANHGINVDDVSAPPNADTLIYYMGRRDCEVIAQQLIRLGKKLDTPVRLLEAISTPRERVLSTNLEGLGNGTVRAWFNDSNPAIIMIGEALGDLVPSELSDSLQNTELLSNGVRYA
ncbi:MAG: uroporphyrinogen-III C-methyltransferase [Betaproteobacteria bacterium]